MRKQLTALLLTTAGFGLVLQTPDAVSAQAPAKFKYEHNFNNMTFYAADGVTLNQAYGEHIIQDACGRTWHMSMGQRFSGEAYLGWNNVQARAEASTLSVQQRFPGLLDYSTGKYYSALSTNFETEKITKIRFEYTAAYAIKPVWIAISVSGGAWQIVLSTNTTATSGAIEYTPTETISSARVALIQNFNSYSNSNGRIKTTNVVMEVA
jgi:hypothetical protein